MSAPDDLQKARHHVADGHHRRAVSAAWRAADSALREGDAEALREVVDLAAQLEQDPDTRVAKDAHQLRSYGQAALDGAGGGVESQSILSRIFRLAQPRKACPDCAEQIPVKARVCRYCGLRFEPQ
jgi:hypothetical protein